MTLSAEYTEALTQLSDASVNKFFQAFVDVPWDDPEYAIVPNDPRWKLPDIDPLGKHPWYLAQTEEDQIRIGMWRQLNVARSGVHTESALMRGLLYYAVTLPNGSPEFRYCMHEVTEETNHTQMFQELVNRAGADVPGFPQWMRALAHALPLATLLFPEVFFLTVLCGEEPLDHMQKALLRSQGELHPLLQRVVQIHVAEEARHISFAHEMLRERVPQLDPIRKTIIAFAFPVMSRLLADVIARPSAEFAKRAGVPNKVMHEAFWSTPESRAILSEMFADVRMFVDELGMLNRFTRPVWKLLGVAGRPSRFRGETHQYFATA